MVATLPLMIQAACTPSSDTTETSPDPPSHGGAPYLPDTLLNAPSDPPQLSLATQSGDVAPRRIAVDWAVRSGPESTPPSQIEWPEAHVSSGLRRAVFEFDTAQLPSRVVLYRYPWVGLGGIPDESSGIENVCHHIAPEAPCVRDGDGSANAQVVVPVGAGIPNPYWVVHAAWRVLENDGSQTRYNGEASEVVSASWVIKIDKE